MPPRITCWCCSCCSPRCTVARGLGLYSLIGLAFLVYQTWPAGQPAGADTLLERGQTYVSAVASIAVYAVPLGFLGYLAQKVGLHAEVARVNAAILDRGLDVDDGRFH
jgi:hypothetical protein